MRENQRNESIGSMFNPTLSLAHSVQSNKGIFAVLLGSGVSRAAGIPTGWEVTIDLVKRVAAMESEEPLPTPEAWFNAKFGTEPEYSALLDTLAKSPSERRAILHSLFEPTDDEREQGLKLPTKAHRAIARLVAKGYVRVIITTNFDRLMETALQDEGIVPTAISTTDAIKGAAPLIHQRCIVLKVHGDYLDDRIKNTVDELSSYDPALDGYLDRIFDEFGLIVCGWSGEWDPALRGAIERCPSRRYTTFWTLRGEPTARVKKLLTLRGAVAVQVKSADEFFEALEDKVTSIEELNAPSALSIGAAVASVKRYAGDPVHRIRLHDLLLREADAVNTRTLMEPVNGVQVNDDYVRRCFAAYDASTEVLRASLYNAAFWAEVYHHDAVKRAVTALVPGGLRNGITVLLDLRLYPAVLAFYAAALGALDGRRYHLFRELTQLTVRGERRTKKAVPDLTCWGAIDRRVALLSEETEWYFPLSEHFRRKIFVETGGMDYDSADHFDRLEVMLALAYLDQAQHADNVPKIMPLGRFAVRHGDSSAYDEVFEEAERARTEWGPLQAGMFSGDLERFEQIKATFMAILKENAHRWW
jgi:hypothetical protein